MQMLARLKSQTNERYLPAFYRDVLEMQRLMQSSDWLKDEVAAVLERLLQNAFVQTSDRVALDAWEAGLGIVHAHAPSIEERRDAIVQKITEQITINEASISREIADILEDRAHEVNIDHRALTMDVEAYDEALLDNGAALKACERVLRPKIPQCILLTIRDNLQSQGVAHMGVGMVEASYYELAVGLPTVMFAPNSWDAGGGIVQRNAVQSWGLNCQSQVEPTEGIVQRNAVQSWGLNCQSQVEPTAGTTAIDLED